MEETRKQRKARKREARIEKEKNRITREGLSFGDALSLGVVIVLVLIMCMALYSQLLGL